MREGLHNGTISASHRDRRGVDPDRFTHMLWVSRRMVNEKQHFVPESFASSSGLFNQQLVKIAFWELSNAMAPNFSQ